MKLAFHKGTDALSRVIEYGTHSPYSHVELVFSDNMSFSARSDRNPAVDIIPFNGSDGLWDFVQIPVISGSSVKDETGVRTWCEAQKGKSYDWAADIAFPLPFVRDDAHKLMCSGSCTAALQQIGLFRTFTPSEVSPGQLFVMATVFNEAKEIL